MARAESRFAHHRGSTHGLDQPVDMRSGPPYGIHPNLRALISGIKNRSSSSQPNKAPDPGPSAANNADAPFYKNDPIARARYSLLALACGFYAGILFLRLGAIGAGMTGATAKISASFSDTADIGLWIGTVVLFFCLGSAVESCSVIFNKLISERLLAKESWKSFFSMAVAVAFVILYASGVYFTPSANYYFAGIAAFVIGAVNAHSMRFHRFASAPVTSSWSAVSSELLPLILRGVTPNSSSGMDSSAILDCWVFRRKRVRQNRTSLPARYTSSCLCGNCRTGLDSCCVVG